MERYYAYRLVGAKLPNHVAIIMDGNRRYARKLGIEAVSVGHESGAEKLEDLLRWCAGLDGLNELTVWALSTDNLEKRDGRELSQLWALCEKHLPKLARSDVIRRERVRVRVIGERHRLPPSMQAAAEQVERSTGADVFDEPRLVFNIALAYGGREEIESAARTHGIEHIADGLYTISAPDLIVRSGGERRLSGFLMWHTKHAELYFTDVLWPAFERVHWLHALYDFCQRHRRFGQ
jgi:undecaprenyl diphosphate synthase